MKSLIDNDVLQKAITFGLHHELVISAEGGQQPGILGAAPFLLRRKLAKVKGLSADEMAARLDAVLNICEILELTELELAHAAELETAAQLAGVDLDPGESQLCSAMLSRGVDRLLTGDKRAIMALEALLAVRTELQGLGGKVYCFEQCFVTRLETHGNHDTLRVAVCGRADTDKALTICFRCHSVSQDQAETISCLKSYIEDLRKKAPHFLAG